MIMWIVQTAAMGFLMYIGWHFADKFVNRSGSSPTISKVKQGFSDIVGTFMDGFHEGVKERKGIPIVHPEAKVVQLDDYRAGSGRG